MKKIYIGLTHDSYITGVLLADNMDLATAFFIGKEEMPHKIEELDLNDKFFDTLPLFSIIRSYKIETWKLRDNRVDEVIICKR